MADRNKKHQSTECIRIYTKVQFRVFRMGCFDRLSSGYKYIYIYISRDGLAHAANENESMLQDIYSNILVLQCHRLH